MIDRFCHAFKITMAAIGAMLSVFLGGMDGLIYALIAFVTVDYITGVFRAIIHHELSSAIGFRGIFHKVLIFALVGVGNILDVYIIKEGNALRTAVIFYYLANEGISILENAAGCGLPVPKKLADVLIQIKEREDPEHGDQNEDRTS